MHDLNTIRALDPWLDRLDALIEGSQAFPSPEIEDRIASCVLIALAMRRPDHPEFVAWRHRALVLFGKQDAAPSLRMLSGFYLFTASLWLGDFTLAGRLIEEFPDTSNEMAAPLARVISGFARSWYYWHTGMNKKCLLTMATTLNLAQATGVHLWDFLVIIQGVVAHLSEGRVQQADDLLQRLEAALGQVRGFDRFYYYHQLAWKNLLKGDLSSALGAQKKALAIAADVGVIYGQGQAHFGMSQVLHACGDERGAMEHLEEARRYGRRLGSRILEFMCLVAETRYRFERGEASEGIRLLRESFQVGRNNGYVNYSWWNSDSISWLCAIALEHDIEPDYAKGLIRKRKLKPRRDMQVESWPWYFRVYTLGRFDMEKKGQLIRFSGKVPRKPIELLKVLIAFGGLDIGEHRLADALWPEVDGDQARRSLKINLHRLRRILARDDAILMAGGNLSINSELFWIDAWALVHLSDRADALWTTDSAAAAVLFEKIIALYRGHFLWDEEAPWAVSLNNRLQKSFARSACRLGEHLELNGRLEPALEHYQRCIDIDPLAESFWIGLLRCLNKLDRRIEATRAYRQFRNILSSQLDIEPSDKLRDLLGPSVTHL
jgi:LuxR family maltose regulon positive regulatory protein